MRYENTGPRERLLYWQGHMRGEWGSGPKPATPSRISDPTALAGTHVPTSQGYISKRKPDNQYVTRRLTRAAVARLRDRLTRKHKQYSRAGKQPEQWEINLTKGLDMWLSETSQLATHHTITSLTNGQWRQLSKQIKTHK